MAIIKSPAPQMTTTTEKSPDVVPKAKVSAEVTGKIACQALSAAYASPGILSYSANEDEYKRRLKEYARLFIDQVLEEQGRAQ